MEDYYFYNSLPLIILGLILIILFNKFRKGKIEDKDNFNYLKVLLASIFLLLLSAFAAFAQIIVLDLEGLDKLSSFVLCNEFLNATSIILFLLSYIFYLYLFVTIIFYIEKKDLTFKVFANKIFIFVIFTLVISVIFNVLMYYEEYNSTSIYDSMKPIIYMYPTEETSVSVILENSDKLTCSYPKYTDGWNVLASPNGNLTDLDTGKNLYALYYENENVVDFRVEDEGFCVKGEDVAEFLEEKLAILGLNDKEKEEFIIYWLPKLEKNKYNYIRFASIDEINENMPLDFSCNPDTLIRVLMTYKGLNKEINVKEQVLEPIQREGFTVVEWGGTEIR